METTVAQLEPYRAGLTGYCYRMLGSAFEAEDAVQETLLRAWRAFERYDERRASLRTWLYSIATNVCLDMLSSSQRRALAMDLGLPSRPGGALGAPLPESTWVQPVPESRVLPPHADPAEAAVLRESIRLAFVAALQHLPPRQRAVVILRDVLRWRAAEVAGLLGGTVAAVNSALQRARATLADVDSAPAEPLRPLDERQRDLLARYVAAFERHDVDTLTALLHEDATMSMPPFAWWLRGRADIRQVFEAGGDACAGDRLVPTEANGRPAFGQYRPGADGLEPFALVLLDVVDDHITGTTTFLGSAGLFPRFDLPARLR
ncbi:sigma-70 family RNA polymerase sigma factor [Qaidamihabitans albus]|uniref:sigma-70 family RNA polymerase sigma factor n=1 Tax=Qaidamihabitans albus TaxID=2795733 RepID=UPI0018F20D29|nr:sigma-70 family RNA polymerase sigma factor [Qaidamihabitans albus]